MSGANEVNVDNKGNNKARNSRGNRLNHNNRASKDNHRDNRVRKVNAVNRGNRVSKVSRDNPDNKASNKVNSKAANNNSPAAHRTAAPIAAAASILVHSGDPWAVTGATIDNYPLKSVNDSAKLRICDASGARPDSARAGSTN